MTDRDADKTEPHRIQLPLRVQVDTSTDTVLNDLRRDRPPEDAAQAEYDADLCARGC